MNKHNSVVKKVIKKLIENFADSKRYHTFAA